MYTIMDPCECMHFYKTVHYDVYILEKYTYIYLIQSKIIYLGDENLMKIDYFE